MEESYKYYDVLEAEIVLHAQVEKNTSSKYVKWVKKILKLNLNDSNKNKTINGCSCTMLYNSIIDWTLAELGTAHGKT